MLKLGLMSQLTVIDIESDLVEAFRTRDRKLLYIPDSMKFPLRFEHYLTWSEPTGNYQFLLFRKYGREELVGMVLDRSNAGQPGRTQMCCWCQTTGSSDKIDMLSISVNAKTIVGVILCVDLSCFEKLETTAKTSKKSVDRLASEVVDRMTHFYEEKLEVNH